MHAKPLEFVERSALGVNDANLKRAMEAARKGIFAKSDKAMAHPQFEAWREAGAAIKDNVLANLDKLLERFEERATAAGATVHWATDAAAANDLVVQIAKQHGCESMIKSKSMLSEEIELNQSLERNALKVLETDLGEYVIQLSQGRPSHIIAPIIHMTQEQVSEIFATHHGKRKRFSKEGLVAEARAQLRPQMMTADMGITGANFLVAATGSTVLVTNEGNGRFCSTSPKVRVTLAGIEKVVPSFAELVPLLRLLPRAATGQTSSSYVSFSTGVSKGARPHHHHVILIDNGRSRMLGNKYRQMLRCIRCGACMNNCPVYKVAGGLSYGSVYSGPMGAVLSPNLFGPQHAVLPHAATMCGACATACPVKIPLPDLMRHLREDQVSAGEQSLGERTFFFLWMFAAQHPLLYSLVARAASWSLRRMGGRNAMVSYLPLLKGWFGTRNLAAPDRSPFRTTINHNQKP